MNVPVRSCAKYGSAGAVLQTRTNDLQTRLVSYSIVIQKENSYKGTFPFGISKLH